MTHSFRSIRPRRAHRVFAALGALTLLLFAGRSADAAVALEAKARADEAFRVLSAVRDQVLVAIEEVKRAVP